MLRFATAFPGRSTPASPDYPYGSAKDETASGVGDGSPILTARSNDILGFQQSLMFQSGIVPSGNADTAKVSDQYDALVKLVTMKYDSVDALRLSVPTINGIMANLTAYYSTQPGGRQLVVWDATSTDTDNGFTVFKVTAITTGRWLSLVDSGNLTDRMAGVKADGTTDDTARMQVALNDCGPKLNIMEGIIGITAPLTGDRRGFKLFGVSESESLIVPIPGFTGTYLLDWGNTSISRNRCEIRNVGFNGNGESGITAIRWRRVNNTSKIVYCSFEELAKGIEFDSLALANTIGWNRFWSTTINIELINEAGNSTLMTGNYFSNGYVYLNNSMTDIKILANTFDGSAYIFCDGVSGPRGLDIIANRFEQTSDVTPVLLGLVRGLMCTGNSFLGSSNANVAIELTSGSALGRYDVHDNHFEEYITTYLKSNAVPDYKVIEYGNMDDGSASTPYNTNILKSPNESFTSEDGIVKINEDRTYFGREQKVLEFTFEKTIAASATPEDMFNIQTGNTEEGGYSCEIDVFANFSPNSTATAVMMSKHAFVHTNANDGTPADSAVTEIYQTPSAATASGTRDITDITLTNANVDNENTKIQASVTFSGSSAPTLIFRVKLMWDNYPTRPVFTVL